MKKSRKIGKYVDRFFMFFIVLLIVISGIIIITNNNKQITLAEPNYEMLFKLGLIPDSQPQPELPGDQVIGVLVNNNSNQQYYLIKNVFGKTFIREINK